MAQRMGGMTAMRGLHECPTMVLKEPMPSTQRSLETMRDGVPMQL